MKKIILFLCLFSSFYTTAQSNYYYYDKRLKKTDAPLKARYYARIPTTNVPTKVMYNGGDESVYAEGLIIPADTLAFDGKVIFYKANNKISDIRFYKNGQPEPNIFVDFSLKKANGITYYSMIVDNNNIFSVLKTEVPEEYGVVKRHLYAVGKVVDRESLLLDSLVIFYNEKGGILDAKKYDKGKELAFISSTVGYDKPHEIMGIVSHSAYDYNNIDAEMACFMAQCKAKGADGVIGVRVSLSSIPSTEFSMARSSLIIQGTTIKLK